MVAELEIERSLAVSSGEVTLPRLSRQRFWRDALRRRFLVVADLATVLAAAAAIGLIAEDRSAAALLAFSFPLFILLAKLVGLYDRDHQELRHLTVDEFPRIVLWALCGTALLTLIAAVGDLPRLAPTDRLLVWAVLIGGGATLRALARHLWRRVTPPEQVVVLGDGALAQAVVRKFDLLGDMHVATTQLRSYLGRNDLGGEPRWLDHADRVIVAASSIDEEVIADLLDLCRARQVKLSVMPPARAVFGTAVELDHIGELPVIEYHTWDVSRTTLLGKRMLDLAVSSTLLAGLAPLLLVIGLAVRVTSRGPALFVQTRAGRYGKPFQMWKFRTMARDAEERLSEVVDLETLEDPVFKIVGDPRTTRLGRFLRRWSLDELPQFWNVLKGEMSLVGPRPEQMEIVARYRPEHRFRLSMKPGMTGPMQVSGRGAMTFEERLAIERAYIEKPTMSRDLRTIALTLAAVVRGDGAY